MYKFYSDRFDLFEGTSANSSTYTSASYLVADYAQLSLSWHSSGVTSLLTLWATNEDGLRSSLQTWSAFTSLTSQGVYAVEPGMRWFRATRSSIDSLGEVFLQART